jgi:hypothetical protein
MKTVNKPNHKLKLGRVSVAIWHRVDSTGTERYGVTLTRSYKTKDGGYKDTHTLDTEDLSHAARLLEEAQNWILAQNR